VRFLTQDVETAQHALDAAIGKMDYMVLLSLQESMQAVSGSLYSNPYKFTYRRDH
jgi:hypothetical protein